jgi:hypothetical protein
VIDECATAGQAYAGPTAAAGGIEAVARAARSAHDGSAIREIAHSLENYPGTPSPAGIIGLRVRDMTGQHNIAAGIGIAAGTAGYDATIAERAAIVDHGRSAGMAVGVVAVAAAATRYRAQIVK